ncbi:MAG: 4a-hydroxytetrahydrobiopterin dehydratase, partial [Acidimicrobiales bacterium]
FRLSTHSAHGVTGLDIALAERIDAIVDAAP